jgi:hypothetical protein
MAYVLVVWSVICGFSTLEVHMHHQLPPYHGHLQTLLEILSFATSHYATSMQLVVICNYLGHVWNYKFGIV